MTKAKNIWEIWNKNSLCASQLYVITGLELLNLIGKTFFSVLINGSVKKGYHNSFVSKLENLEIDFNVS